jgi:hypothetical protein
MASTTVGVSFSLILLQPPTLSAGNARARKTARWWDAVGMGETLQSFL